MLIKSALLLAASVALGLGQTPSCNWQDLQLSWPVKLDASVRPGYGNLKGLFFTTQYVGFTNPADPNGKLIDYTGAERGNTKCF